MKMWIGIAGMIALLAGPAVAQDTPPATELSAVDVDTRRVALRRLLDEHWEATLRRSPEFASILGDRRYNDRVSDVSEKAVRAELEQDRRFLRRFEAIRTEGFSEEEILNRDLMVKNLRDAVDGARFRDHLMPVTQISGIHLQSAQLPSLLPFTSTRDYEDYVVRLRKLPRQFDETIANMRKGRAEKLMPPKFVLEKIAEQAEEIAKTPADTSPFAVPLQQFPATFSEEEKTRVRREVVAAIRASVIPAYQKFATFVRKEYAPRGRTQFGVWSLPDGKPRYAHLVRTQTTTNLTAEEIHQIGLREVARIEGEMLEIARKLGFNDLQTFNKSLETNDRVRVQSADELVDLYRQYIGQMYAKLPQLFGRLPKAALEIQPTPSFREGSSASADYNPGSPDGSRPGRVYVNTYEATTRKKLPIESTSYHEGVPGHHMQLSIQQELTDLPPFRQQGGETAFVEGWALYSERLGKEVGFYQDPYTDYGRLNDEMLRAIRLVVDTGLHAKKWSRDQVVKYFRDHSAIDEVEIQSETDRYIVWPGQALAYKIGQLKILELRERAQKELGSRFDIRSFHDELLGAGALPMQVLEERMNRWMDRQKRR
jgi:uncharacterized protein (DUF885 family)